ncbi:MAG: hypothetical protein A2992_10005 [Elusimicrobia bacterium RIFCSPLOWO2_01_FULL_59_12]|nr:MAG: hypothetical protein A2992_10005 [Elusimicrobia bacterium RIFCSPLOWO2_01_FULL_59_12]
MIGLGVGEHHAAAYLQHPRCRLVAVCDRSPEKRDAARSRFPEAAVAADAKELLTDPAIDLVSIASFDDDHYTMERMALEQGKHLFVEKPLCQSPDELRALHQAWKHHEGRVKLTSNLVLRAAPLYRWLKDQILSGRLGELYAFDAEYLYGRVHKITEGWRKDVDNYSAMQGGGVHMMDLLFWLTGQRPTTVTTLGNRIATRETAFRYNDYMAAMLKCPSGLIARITANFGCVHRHQHVLRIFGTKGTFIYDDAGARLHTSRDPAVPSTPVTLAALPASKGDLIPEFVDAVLKETDLTAETQSHFDVMSALIASDQSVASGGTREIEYL